MKLFTELEQYVCDFIAVCRLDNIVILWLHTTQTVLTNCVLTAIFKLYLGSRFLLSFLSVFLEENFWDE